MLLLHFEELLDGGGSGDLLPDRFIWPQVWFGCLVGEEFTVLAEMRLNDIYCETLMDSGMARLALVATPVWYPLVLVGLPDLDCGARSIATQCVLGWLGPCKVGKV